MSELKEMHSHNVLLNDLKAEASWIEEFIQKTPLLTFTLHKQSRAATRECYSTHKGRCQGNAQHQAMVNKVDAIDITTRWTPKLHFSHHQRERKGRRRTILQTELGHSVGLSDPINVKFPFLEYCECEKGWSIEYWLDPPIHLTTLPSPKKM